MTTEPETTARAALERIRKRARYEMEIAPSTVHGGEPGSAEDAARMADGYDALLKLAGELDAKSASLWEQISATLQTATGVGPELRAASASAYSNAASRIRSVIAAALTGEVPAP